MILVEKQGEEGFTAKVVFESAGIDWETKTPITKGELVRKLKDFDIHPVDIYDVMGEAARCGRGFLS